jgi:HK97 family phage prohead protease
MQKEIRYTTELRTTGDEFALVGYAARHNVLSHNLGGFREIIRPGTFTRSLKAKADVKCLLNHAADNILGRTKSGTLTLGQDDRGLSFRCQLDRSNSDHQNLYASIKRGDIDECSFAFTVAPGGQKWDEGKDPETGEDCLMRSLTDVDLLDVSAVTYPAYPSTSVGARYFPDGDVNEIRQAKASFSKRTGIVLPSIEQVRHVNRVATKRTGVEPLRKEDRITPIQLLVRCSFGKMGSRTALRYADAKELVDTGYAKFI